MYTVDDSAVGTVAPPEPARVGNRTAGRTGRTGRAGLSRSSTTVAEPADTRARVAPGSGGMLVTVISLAVVAVSLNVVGEIVAAVPHGSTDRQRWQIGAVAVAATVVVATIAVGGRHIGSAPGVARAVAIGGRGVAWTTWLAITVPFVHWPPSLLWAWLIPVAIGADVTLVATATDVAWRRLWWPLWVFGAQVVLAAAVLAALAYDDTDVVAIVAVVYAVAIVGYVVASTTARVVRSYEAAAVRQAVDATRAEHRRRASWIHDEVLTELRLARLKIELAAGPEHPVLAELGRVEHQLRLRQLDADLVAGQATFGDVLAPFVRMVMQANRTVTGVPGAEIGRRPVGAIVGRELQRFLGVAVPNALLAGASTVRFEVTMQAATIRVAVIDDAGGFVEHPCHAGRGRDRLARELGADRLATEPCPGGTVYSAVFPLSCDPPTPTRPATSL